MKSEKDTAVLLVTCPDQRGLVAHISQFLYQKGANILHADQHEDSETHLFFMRVEWDWKTWPCMPAEFRSEFEPIASQFNMNWKLALSNHKPKVGIFVSTFDHC